MSLNDIHTLLHSLWVCCIKNTIRNLSALRDSFACTLRTFVIVRVRFQVPISKYESFERGFIERHTNAVLVDGKVISVVKVWVV